MKRIHRIKCMVPFTILSVNQRGYCYSCCPTWTKIGNVGRLSEHHSVMAIWNNERMQYIRKAVLDNKLEKVCNFRYCPYVMKHEYINLESMKNDDEKLNHIIDQIMNGSIVMDNPPYVLEVASSAKCNLKCVMCLSNDKCSANDRLLDEKLFTRIIPEILPGISRMFLTGNGEVFFNPYSRKFLQSLDSGRYPSLKIRLLSNGTLFSPRLWETILQNRYESISISIDAATKETYEKIRKNGNWNGLRRNLDFIGELRRNHVFSYFCITFIVMKSNYHEMKEFVELGRRLGCDSIIFQKIFGMADIRENIHFTNNQKVMAEIAEILTDPVFSDPDVDITLIEDYRKYLKKTVPWGNCMVVKAKEWLLYYPIQLLFSISKYFPFLSDIYEFLKRKRVPKAFPGH